MLFLTRPTSQLSWHVRQVGFLNTRFFCMDELTVASLKTSDAEISSELQNGDEYNRMIFMRK